MAETETTMKTALLIFNIIILSVGSCAGPLLSRFYFIHGGHRVWLSSWLQTSAFPIILLPVTIAYRHRRRHAGPPSPATKFFLMKPRLFLAAAVIGIICGTDNYLYACGVARLPISTSSLIIATQLVFTATFAFFLVKQKFTPYSINAVVLLTLGAGILALHTSNDRPGKESDKDYAMGFVMTLLAAFLYGFLLPLVELSYLKAKQEINYALVMEFQMATSLFGTVFCTVGMLINNDFQASPAVPIIYIIFSSFFLIWFS